MNLDSREAASVDSRDRADPYMGADRRCGLLQLLSRQASRAVVDD